MTLLLGKRPAIKPYGLSDLAVYAQGKLPTPPAAVAPPTVSSWGMMLNDTYGDCVMAMVGHDIIASNVEVKGNDTVPADSQIKAQYFALTGGQDSGLNESAVLQRWYRKGLFPFANKIAGYAPVNPSLIRDVQQAIAFYGACLVGVQLPQSAQEQFPNEWTVVPGSPIEGGHAILYVGYDQKVLYAVSWGQCIAVTYPWHHAYCDESWAVIPQAFVKAKHGPSLDIASLRHDLDALEDDVH